MTRIKHNEAKLSNFEEENPWIGIVAGVILLFAAWFIYDIIAEMELSGGSNKIGSYVIELASKIKLRFIVPAIIIIISAYNIISSARDIIERNKNKK